MDHDNDSNKATEKKNSLALRRFFREMILHYVALIATKHILCSSTFSASHGKLTGVKSHINKTDTKTSNSFKKYLKNIVLKVQLQKTSLLLQKQ